jgi:hypothetical protein
VTSAARSAGPVALTALVTTALVVLAAAFQATAGALPFVERVAGLALAGSAAYLLDDAAAQLTAVVPQGPWRRRAPGVGAGVVVLAVAWLGFGLVLEWRDVRPPLAESSAELVVMVLVAIAAAATLFRLGDSEPGVVVAPLLVVLGLGVTIVESVVRAPIFLTGAEPTPGRVVGWSAAGVVAVVVIVLAGRDVGGEPERVMRAAASRR